MRTKTRHTIFGIKLIIVLPMFILIQKAYSQSVLSGLGIEVGGGYNQLYWQEPLKIGIAPFNPLIVRNDFALTPEIRLKYVVHMKNYFSLLPFIGYNRFGGYRKRDDDSYDKVWCDALDLGVIAGINISNLSFGIGYKANRINNVTGWDHYSSDEQGIFNLTNRLQSWAQDVGLRISYKFGNFDLAGESWFGISELAGTKLPSEASIRENHFRVFIGYSF